MVKVRFKKPKRNKSRKKKIKNKKVMIGTVIIKIKQNKAITVGKRNLPKTITTKRKTLSKEMTQSKAKTTT